MGRGIQHSPLSYCRRFAVSAERAPEPRYHPPLRHMTNKVAVREVCPSNSVPPPHHPSRTHPPPLRPSAGRAGSVVSLQSEEDQALGASHPRETITSNGHMGGAVVSRPLSSSATATSAWDQGSLPCGPSCPVVGGDPILFEPRGFPPLDQRLAPAAWWHPAMDNHASPPWPFWDSSLGPQAFPCPGCPWPCPPWLS